MEQAFDRIVGRIYDVALNQQGWPALLEDIANTIGAVAGFYAGLDTRREQGAYWYAYRHTHEVQALYNRHFLAMDPTLPHLLERPGRAICCTEHITDEVAATHPFYTQFLLPNGIRYVLSAVVSMRGSIVSFFGFQRALQQAPFGAVEAAFMQRLIPHFQKADELTTRMSEIGQAKRVAMAFLDRLTYGVVFVDNIRRIRMTNQKAENWLDRAQVVAAKLGRLSMCSGAEDAVLGQLICSASSAMVEHSPQGGSFDSSDDAGDVRARLVVLPIGNDERLRLDDEEATAAVVIVDAAQHNALAPRFLQDEHGLTTSEIRMAMGLAAGQTIKELSECHNVTPHTVRSHMRNIFRKTGIARQTDLVRLVYRIPALV